MKLNDRLLGHHENKYFWANKSN